jgi:hypothetical protein
MIRCDRGHEHETLDTAVACVRVTKLGRATETRETRESLQPAAVPSTERHPGGRPQCTRAPPLDSAPIAPGLACPNEQALAGLGLVAVGAEIGSFASSSAGHRQRADRVSCCCLAIQGRLAGQVGELCPVVSHDRVERGVEMSRSAYER